MKKGMIRTGLIIIVLALIVYYLTPLIPGVKNSLPDFWTQKQLKLGLDLQGGMQIVLDVDTSKVPKAEKEQAINSALKIIRNRIDQFGVSEPSIQKVGDNRILVQLPGLKDFSRAKKLIGKTALLEFKLLAEADEITKAKETLDNYLKNNIEKFEELKKFEDDYQMIAEDDETNSDLLAEDEEMTDEKKAEQEEDKNIIYETMFTDLASTGGRDGLISPEYIPLMKSLLNDNAIKRIIPRGIQIALSRVEDNDSSKPREVFFLYKKAELEGKYLQSASVQIGSGYDPKTANRPYVSLGFNKIGAKKFERISGQHIGKRLAIVLDGVVYVAPTIQDKIRSGKAQITGGFTLEEANDIVIVLKAGNLPAPVNVIEERTVGPTLGSDSIRSGILAAIYGLALIVIFMLFYYGLSGFVADLAVAINMLFVLAALTIFEGTLTMPGIAGLILTIGMAVDANVLIFERIREELRKGKTVRTAVDSGFSRALVTILDANITTLITALVLFQFGTGPIKGFAVTLSIGIIGSMFCSIILVKAIFDGVITNKNRKKLSV